jgi:hypothetical protein
MAFLSPQNRPVFMPVLGCEQEPISVAVPNKSHSQLIADSSKNATSCVAAQHDFVLTLCAARLLQAILEMSEAVT